VRIRGDGELLSSPFAKEGKLESECGLLRLAPKSFFDARDKARDRAFVAERPAGIGTPP